MSAHVRLCRDSRENAPVRDVKRLTSSAAQRHRGVREYRAGIPPCQATPKRPRNVVSCFTPGCGRARCTRPYRSARCAGRVWRRHPGNGPVRDARILTKSAAWRHRCGRERCRDMPSSPRTAHETGAPSWVRFWRSSQAINVSDTSVVARCTVVEPPWSHQLGGQLLRCVYQAANSQAGPLPYVPLAKR